ncbi:MAG: CerR family C-terminal domain-containing protein [Opitutales bacterium]|nr:CerR family C-terminal domain-containing protein [Opitutales bacterium]
MVETGEENCGAEAIKAKSAESTKRAILRAALEEFALKSVSGARAREISAKAGVNHAAINYHFGGKNEMYEEILRAAVDSFRAEISEFLAEADAFLKSPVRDKSAAIEMIKKAFLRTHNRLSSENFMRLMLLLKREEIFPSRSFDITFEGSFKPSMEALVSLILVLKEGASRQSAIMTAFTLIGLNDSVCSCRTAYLRLSGKSEIDESDIAMFGGIVSEQIERILS